MLSFCLEFWSALYFLLALILSVCIRVVIHEIGVRCRLIVLLFCVQFRFRRLLVGICLCPSIAGKRYRIRLLKQTLRSFSFAILYIACFVVTLCI